MRRPTSNPTRSSTVALCSAAFWDGSKRMGDLVGVGNSVAHIFFISSRNQGGGTNERILLCLRHIGTRPDRQGISPRLAYSCVLS
jgi:hypothetical protein